MKTWVSHAIHYSDLDRLILEAIDPHRNILEEEATHYHWVRHYAGGVHMRVHVKAEPAAHDRISSRFYSAVRSFIEGHPSSPAEANYDTEQVRRMLENDGYEATKFDLTYRNNSVRPVSYVRDREAFASEEALELMESFRYKSIPLNTLILRSSLDRTEALLHLFLLHCKIISGGNYVSGALSFKSHWEGFRLAASPEVVATLQAPYKENRSSFKQAMEKVSQWYESWKQGKSDPAPGIHPAVRALLEEWASLEVEYVKRTSRLLKAGVPLVRYPDREEWSLVEEHLEDSDEQSPFIERISDAGFGPAMHHNSDFTIARVLVNFLYSILTSVGGSPIEKYMLCFSTYRTIEENHAQSFESAVERVVEITKRHGAETP